MAGTHSTARHRREDWHVLSVAEVWQALEATEDGLTSSAAAVRRRMQGSNRLPQTPPPPWWEILLRQFQSPLIYVLLAAAVVAVLAGDVQDAAFIGLVLAVNALIGGYQEWRAEQSSRALQRMLHMRAVVLRDGEVQELDADELVPGDVVWLESGNRVPADLRLLTTQGLEVDESLLTGESLAVCKDAGWSGDAASPAGDRQNLCYAAAIVVRGRAHGVVVATGVNTLVGQLAVDVVSRPGGPPPLIARMERFSRTLAYTVLAAVSVVGFLGVVLRGQSLQEMFLFGVALAVSAIPEGLPAALTIALGVATTRMARRGVIVRRLAAVEGLGSCTLIASDKTGTLTCNELTVRMLSTADGRTCDVTGEGFAPEGEVLSGGRGIAVDASEPLRQLVRVAALCNEGDLHLRGGRWVWRGDPTDIALLSLAHKTGITRERLLDEFPQVHALPFEPEQQYAATYHRTATGVRVFVKGAPERVLAMCDWSATPPARNALREQAEQLAGGGYRVLAFADGPTVPSLDAAAAPPHPQGLEFRGFVGMIDPLRPGVPAAVAKCRAAGITVCMVTGDHPVTALAIARDLGLAHTAAQVVTGADLAGRSADELRAAVRQARVFARVAPRQKLDLVEAARAAGHFVAVTGDGVNDAPALRAANIGVAMGKDGTDVAREAAQLVISDDNFASIVNGVEEGRIAYDNVRKVIYLLVSTGAAEVLLIGATFAAGATLPLPFTPVQLLWLNLVTNGIQGIALAFEPGESDVLDRRPRRPTEPIFDRLMIERTIVGAVVMAGVGAGAYAWMIRSGWTTAAARNGLLLLMVLFENVHIGNCRSETQSALRLSPLRSPFLLLGALGALLIHAIAMHWPWLQAVLHVAPLSPREWMMLAGLSLTVFAALELHKLTWRLRGRSTAAEADAATTTGL